MPERCLTAEHLDGLIRQTLADPEQTAALQHLDRCAACRQTLEQRAGKPSWLNAVAPTDRSGSVARKFEPAIKQFCPSPPATKRIEAVPRDSSLDSLQPSNNASRLGRLGSYEVIEEIARGGMGIVFKARDTTLDRVVAIKALAPALAHDPSARTRFLREARAAAAITHDHVITIHAVEEGRDVPYLVMQFVSGRSLEERLACARPLRVEEILRIGFQTASGLAAAHERGLIHRDIKPSNILLESPGDRVKITDFGLARTINDTTLTLPGHIAGTPEYMSPEQARGEGVDTRSDLFSLGCVLYEMATGVSPFHGETPMASLRRVCDEEPVPVHLLNPAVPEWLSEIIASLLRKNPAQRSSSAAGLAEQLGAGLTPPPQPSPGTPPMPKRGAARELRMRLPRRTVAALCLVGMICISAIVAGLILHRKRGGTSAVSNTGDRFVLISADNKTLQRFNRFADAVLAAAPGAVIELRFNDEMLIEPVILDSKPLILRAASDRKPILVATSRQPLITTLAPLVIEGVAFKTSSAAENPRTGIPQRPWREPQAGPPGEMERPLHPAVFVQSKAASLMVANCRFSTGGRAASAMNEGPTAILIESCPFALFENCHFEGASGRAIEIYRNRGALGAATVAVRNCVQLGSDFLSVVTETRENVAIELIRNTVVGEAVVHAGHPPRTLPLAVTATRNVFDVQAIYRRDPFLFAQGQRLGELLRWEDEANVFSVQDVFARALRTQIESFGQWKAELQIAAGTSVDAHLELASRLQERKDSPNEFGLTRDELRRLNVAAGKTVPGADVTLVGPGEAYASWRRTPRHEEWQELVRQHGFAP